MAGIHLTTEYEINYWGSVLTSVVSTGGTPFKCVGMASLVAAGTSDQLYIYFVPDEADLIPSATNDATDVNGNPADYGYIFCTRADIASITLLLQEKYVYMNIYAGDQGVFNELWTSSFEFQTPVLEAHRANRLQTWASKSVQPRLTKRGPRKGRRRR